MATLSRGLQQITVPDEVAGSYEAEGWLGEVAPAVKIRPSRKRAAKKSKQVEPKAVGDAVPIRADGEAGAAEAGR